LLPDFELVGDTCVLLSFSIQGSDISAGIIYDGMNGSGIENGPGMEEVVTERTGMESWGCFGTALGDFSTLSRGVLDQLRLEPNNLKLISSIRNYKLSQ